MSPAGPVASARILRQHRMQQQVQDGASRRAVLVSIFAAMMMAIAVEVYYADLVPEAAPLPHQAHLQAFAAACAGFLPALFCLQRLNSGSWSRAARLTAPWLLLVPDALVAVLFQPQWYWVVVITLPLGIAAYLAMLRSGHRLPHA